MADIVLAHSNDAPRKHRVTTAHVTIGRAADNHIQIADCAASRHHALVINAINQTILVDLNSRNGTYVNTKRIVRHVLRPGDLIRLGRHHLIYAHDGTFISGANPLILRSLATATYRQVLRGRTNNATAPHPTRAQLTCNAGSATMPRQHRLITTSEALGPDPRLVHESGAASVETTSELHPHRAPDTRLARFGLVPVETRSGNSTTLSKTLRKPLGTLALVVGAVAVTVYTLRVVPEQRNAEVTSGQMSASSELVSAGHGATQSSHDLRPDKLAGQSAALGGTDLAPIDGAPEPSLSAQPEEAQTQSKLDPSTTHSGDTWTDRTIARLLSVAERQLAQLHLTTPRGDNAFDTYRAILELDRENQRAQNGLTRIADSYYALAVATRKRGALVESLRMTNRGLTVKPDNEALQLLREALLDAFAATLSAKQRLADRQRRHQVTDGNGGRAAAADPPSDQTISSQASPAGRQHTAETAQVPQKNELPPHIHKSLGQLRIKVHVYYDEPARRFVRINRRRYREGDALGDSGAIVKQITRDGVIIGYGQAQTLIKAPTTLGRALPVPSSPRK